MYGDGRQARRQLFPGDSPKAHVLHKFAVAQPPRRSAPDDPAPHERSRWLGTLPVADVVRFLRASLYLKQIGHMEDARTAFRELDRRPLGGDFAEQWNKI